MLISVKDKNFSGQLVKDDGELVIQLKPYNINRFVKIKNGFYEYLNANEISNMIMPS